MKKKGVLVVVSGFSGVGKGTVIKTLMGRFPKEYAFSISATTRSPREGEVHGREYYFITEAEFKKMIEEDQLVEYTCYQGRYYGTPVASVADHLEAGVNVILDIEVEGALNIKKKFPEALTIFLIPPRAAALKARLEGRGTETEAQILGRLARAAEEAAIVGDYEGILVNDDLDTCVETLRRVIADPSLAESYYSSNLAKARTMEAEINLMLKGE